MDVTQAQSAAPASGSKFLGLVGRHPLVVVVVMALLAVLVIVLIVVAVSKGKSHFYGGPLPKWQFGGLHAGHGGTMDSTADESAGERRPYAASGTGQHTLAGVDRSGASVCAAGQDQQALEEASAGVALGSVSRATRAGISGAGLTDDQLRDYIIGSNSQ